MKEPITYTLKEPITPEKGDPITEFTFRHPNGQDYRKMPVQPNLIGDLMDIAGRLLVGQPSSLVYSLEHPDDIAYVINLAADFFQAVQQTSTTRSRS